MLLNAVEKALMNNAVRAAIQGSIEVPRLLSLGGSMRKGRALEIGCGRGAGAWRPRPALRLSGSGLRGGADVLQAATDVSWPRQHAWTGPGVEHGTAPEPTWAMPVADVRRSLHSGTKPGA